MEDQELPTDNDGWFKRHIIEGLNELKVGQSDLARAQRDMHRENVERMNMIAATLENHEEKDRENFEEVRSGIRDLQPVKKITYGMVAAALLAVLTAILGTVILNKITR